MYIKCNSFWGSLLFDIYGHALLWWMRLNYVTRGILIILPQLPGFEYKNQRLGHILVN